MIISNWAGVKKLRKEGSKSYLTMVLISCRGWGSVGKAVATDTRDLQLESQ